MRSTTRRHFLKSALSAGAILPIRRAWGAAATTRFSCIAETAAGRVRGALTNNVYVFKGIPYGQFAGGENRFLPPRPPVPWIGIRDAADYGYWAMQTRLSAEGFPTQIVKLYAGWWPSSTHPTSEDCLSLNVWSPSLRPNGPLPVMVWLHGGGFDLGSGDSVLNEGSNLAHKGDVVVVSLNHRLNIFGHLYLGEIGPPEFANSGNAGMLDIVAALEWVRDNIAAFGGDPRNVTIFGQSGGGSKVAVLMAMPRARGLFHKAISMSGPGLGMLTRDQASRTAEQVLAHLNIRANDVTRLQRVPAEQLINAMAEIYKQAHLTSATWRDGTWYHFFAPVVDGGVLPSHPIDSPALMTSSSVPLLIGTCNEDSRIGAGLCPPLTFSLNGLEESSMHRNLQSLGIETENAGRLIASFRATRPGISNVDVFSAIATELEFRYDAIKLAECKANLGKAPCYMYLFTWESPAFDGKYKCAHGFDLPFFFSNIDVSPGLWGPNPDPRRYRLADVMSKSLVTFARAGSPAHTELPKWESYTSTDRATVLFNYACKAVDDPKREDRLALERLWSRSTGEQ